jgi:hypothetical protein
VQERHKQGDYETFPEGHPDYPAGDQITRFGAPGSGFEASIPGWHGTPHEFEPVEHNPFGQFDDSKMGTGEGAQVRGWGHYLAGNPQTAISYRDALAGDVPRHVIMDNGNFSEGFDSHRYDPAMPNFGRENALFEFWGNGGDLAQTQRLMKNKKEQADNTVQSLANRLAVETSPVHRDRQAHMLKLAQQAAKGYQDALDTVAKEGHTWTLPEPNGHLLHVEMHPEEHELLDLDRTVAEQHPDVQKKLWALPGPIGDVFTHDMSSNGEDIQDSIRDHFHQGLSGGGWSDAGDNALHNQAHELTKDLPPELSDWDRAKAATSRLLDQAGIPGNRFLDQGSRSAAPEIKLDGQRLESIPSTLDDGSPKTIFDYSPEELVRDRLYRELNYGSSHYEGPAGVKELIEDTKEHFEKEIENRKEWETPGNFFYQKDVVPTVPHYEAALKWLKENAQKLQWHEPEVTRNYVMFHPRHVTIKGRNGQMLEPVEHNPFEGLE